MLFDPARHEPLAVDPWSESAARRAIETIAVAASRAFDPRTLWPAHARDVEDGDPALPRACLYHGAAGVIWALRHLQRQGLAEVAIDFDAPIDGLLGHHQRFNKAAGMDGAGSYFLGDAGVLLLQWQHRREPATADALFAVVQANLHNPTLEPLWGSPGTLVAALHMLEATQEPRWRSVFREGVDILWHQMHTAQHSDHPGRDVWLWTQDLYGKQRMYMGAGHGFAGNLFPVLRGARWLDDAVVAGFDARAFDTLDVAASRDAGRINWDPVFDPRAADIPRRPLVQDCHGAAGTICRLAATRSADLKALLLQAGELVWTAGPLTKPPGLCHGTDGNGYAFLKLHAMTGDARWLERARAFAMHAIAQSDALAAQHGQRRYTLWTGDLGLAVYLSSCLRADPAFPTLDVF